MQCSGTNRGDVQFASHGFTRRYLCSWWRGRSARCFAGQGATVQALFRSRQNGLPCDRGPRGGAQRRKSDSAHRGAAESRRDLKVARVAPVSLHVRARIQPRHEKLADGDAKFRALHPRATSTPASTPCPTTTKHAHLSFSMPAFLALLLLHALTIPPLDPHLLSLSTSRCMVRWERRATL